MRTGPIWTCETIGQPRRGRIERLIRAESRIVSKMIASMSSVRYTIGMGSKSGSRIAGCKPIGLAFAFILSVTQVYPAFGACLCLYETQEIVKISTPSEDAPSCHSAAAGSAMRDEMDSVNGYCAQEADLSGSNTRISPDDCCGAESGWVPPLPASVSRTVEIRPAFDAMASSCSGDTGTVVPRFEGLTRGPEPGIRTGFGTTLYLLNASLLI